MKPTLCAALVMVSLALAGTSPPTAPTALAAAVAPTAPLAPTASSAPTAFLAPTAAVAPTAPAPAPPPPDARYLPSGTPTPVPGVRRGDKVCATTPTVLTEQTARPYLWGQQLLNLEEAWRAAGTKGKGVRIAVIDTGVNPHPLLRGRLYAGGDFVATGDGTQDCDAHGTAVAGIAAAAPDLVTRFSGVAPEADVIAIRQTSESYSDPAGDTGTAGNIASLARAVRRAADLGADVINISEVACAPADAVGAAPLRAAIRHAVRHGAVVVAAAGNTSTTCRTGPNPGIVPFPAWFDDDVLAVASIGPGGGASSFTVPGPWLDVAAPGEGVASLGVTGAVTEKLHGLEQVSAIDGTSFAAPAVSGLAALIHARYPSLTPGQIIDRITATASQHSAGRADTLGYGTINPLEALTRQPAVLAPPRSDPAGAADGRLLLTPSPHPPPAGPAAVWGGVLALLACITAGAIGAARVRAPGGRSR